MKRIILIILMFLFVSANSQNICKTDVCVVEFNASWNKANSVDWLDKLNDCGVQRINKSDRDWETNILTFNCTCYHHKYKY